MFDSLKWLYTRWLDVWFRLGEIPCYHVGYEVVTSYNTETRERTDFLLIRIKFKVFGFIPMWIQMYDESIEDLHSYKQHKEELLKQCLEEDYGEQKQCTKQF